MRKVFLVAICLMLAGLLAVNSTFAAEFTQAVRATVSHLFKTVSELISPEPYASPTSFKVSVVYLDDEGAEQQVLMPGSTLERKVAVHNESDSLPAYFRIAFAVQNEALDCMELTFSNDDSFAWLNEWRDITIGGRGYQLMVGTYTTALDAGSTSPALLLSVALNATATSDQLATVDANFLQLKVLAINAADFVLSDGVQMSAVEALDKALPINYADFNPFI